MRKVTAIKVENGENVFTWGKGLVKINELC